MPGSASTLVVSLTRKSGRPSSVGAVRRTTWFSSWMFTWLMSEVLVLPKASVCWKDAAKLMNCPSSVEVIYHNPSALACGPMAPKSSVNDGDTDWLVPTCEPMIEKAMSRSFEFSMILRLCGGDAEILGAAIALVLDEDAQRKRYGRLDLRREGIIAIHIVLEEIIHVKNRCRQHGNRHREQGTVTGSPFST